MCSEGCFNIYVLVSLSDFIGKKLIRFVSIKKKTQNQKNMKEKKKGEDAVEGRRREGGEEESICWKEEDDVNTNANAII